MLPAFASYRMIPLCWTMSVYLPFVPLSVIPMYRFALYWSKVRLLAVLAKLIRDMEC